MQKRTPRRGNRQRRVQEKQQGLVMQAVHLALGKSRKLYYVQASVRTCILTTYSTCARMHACVVRRYLRRQKGAEEESATSFGQADLLALHSSRTDGPEVSRAYAESFGVSAACLISQQESGSTVVMLAG